MKVCQSGVYGLEVLPNDFVALLTVSLLYGAFDLGNGLFSREDPGDGEEAGLHNRVDAHPHTGLLSHVVSVYHVGLDLLLDDLFLDLPRQIAPYLVRPIGRVQQKHGVRGRIV